MAANRFNFDEVRTKLIASRRETLVILSNQAQNYFVKSFKNQGFDGQPWKEVKRRTKDTKAYKYPKTKGLQRRTQPILIGAGWKIRGGQLRRSVSMMARTAQIGNGTLRMIVDVPYAIYHNEGGKHLPKRQFVGQTPQLTKMQQDKIKEIIDKTFKI